VDISLNDDEFVVPLDDSDANLSRPETDQRRTEQAVVLAAVIAVHHVGELVARSLDCACVRAG
jgi:hypothetical protein